MNLIVNADDFGYSIGVNHGILDAYARGIVTSTTVMACGAAFGHAVWMAKNERGLAVGVHLTLTSGRPLTGGLRAITGKTGEFPKREELESMAKNVDPDDVEREFCAQIERVFAEGIAPTHLDSHHHIHMQEPFLSVFARVCARYGLPARCREESRERLRAHGIPTPDALIEGFFGDQLGEDSLTDLLGERLASGTVELMCHPAYLDRPLLCGSSYALPRALELEILTGNSAKEFIRRHKIRLSNYRSLFGRRVDCA